MALTTIELELQYPSAKMKDRDRNVLFGGKPLAVSADRQEYLSIVGLIRKAANILSLLM